MASCLFLEPLSEVPKQCAWKDCRKPLPKWRRKWCSDPCANRFSANHVWSFARHTVLKRDGRKCVRCGSTRALEVNHTIPRKGEGYGTGCWNHLDNLELLCRECHVAETARQQGWKKKLGQLAQSRLPLEGEKT